MNKKTDKMFPTNSVIEPLYDAFYSNRIEPLKCRKKANCEIGIGDLRDSSDNASRCRAAIATIWSPRSSVSVQSNVVSHEFDLAGDRSIRSSKA